MSVCHSAGGRSSGRTSILYNPHSSERGALLCVAQAPKKRVPFGFETPVIIHNPHALPMYKEPGSKKRQREKELADPVKTRRPDPGTAIAGIGKGGKIGTTGGTLLTQYVLKHKVGRWVSHMLLTGACNNLEFWTTLSLGNALSRDSET